MTEIEKLGACEKGVAFRQKYDTFEEAWNECPRGKWMLWLSRKLQVDDRIIRLAEGLCANTVRHLMEDDRSKAYVDAKIAYGRGEISKKEMQEMEEPANTAASIHSESTPTASSYAAYAALFDLPNPAYAAAFASSSATYAKAHNQKQTADICREILTDAVLTKINNI